MRTWILPLAALLLAGCRASAPVPPEVPPDANFVVTMREAIASPEQDLPTQLKVFKDGQPAGETRVAPASVERRWGARYEPGNYLFRFERWVQTPAGDWEPSSRQPRERFVRVDAGERTEVTLKFFDRGYAHLLEVQRQ